MKTLRIIGKAAVAFYDELFHFLLMGFVTLISFLLVIPGPFAIAGLYAVAQKAVRGEGVRWTTYWSGVKEYGLRSFVLFLITLVGYVLVITNIWFYNTPEISPFSPTVAAWVTPLWIVVALIWTGVVFYATAFLVELEKPTIPIVLRNSLFLTALNPIPTLVWLIVSAIALGLSIALPVLLVISPAFIITLALTAVRTLVVELLDRAKAEEEAKAQREAAEREPEEEDEAAEDSTE